MKKETWRCTLITQLSLFVAAYVALNIGQPQKHSYGNSLGKGRPMDMYFISVAGGYRPLDEQTLLLKQMMKVVKAYDARFIVDISELGESDPLMRNATKYPDLRNMPWYTTGALFGKGDSYFLKKIKIPNGQTLDVIAVDTFLFQDLSSAPGNEQIQWLKTTLKATNSDWRIVVGFHHIVSCDYNTQDMGESPSEPLLNILQRHGVDAYLSRTICTGYIQGSATDTMDRGPLLTPMNRNLGFKREKFDGFLLHRVSSMEMAAFYVTLTGEVEHKLAFQQRGKAAM